MPAPTKPGPDGKWVDTWTDEELENYVETPEQAAQRRQIHKDAAWLFQAAMKHLFQNDSPPDESPEQNLEDKTSK